MSDLLKHGQSKDHSPPKISALLPEFRSINPQKWKGENSSDFLPAYKNFAIKTLNGFHQIQKGKVLEKNGTPIKRHEHYNPYINSHFDIGHKFRKRMSHREISADEFKSYTSSDIMMKNSTYSSTSIRSSESQSAFNLAKATLERLEPMHSPYGRNPDIRIHFKTLEDDLDIMSPQKSKRKKQQSNRYNSISGNHYRISLNMSEFESNRSNE